MFGFYCNFANNLKKGKIMIDFSKFDSLMAMTTCFNNEDVCKNAYVLFRSTNLGKIIDMSKFLLPMN